MRMLVLATAIISGITASSLAQRMSPDAPNHLPSTPPTLLAAYGDDPLQVGELRLPAGQGPFPVVVVIHGGCWTKGFATMRHTAAMASALTDKGVATWNIEYRQIGDAGAGWPGSFQDWGAGTDYLRTLAETYPLDISKVVVTGHSAGAQAALFVASRPKLPEDSEVRGGNPLPVSAVVAIDGPVDLASFIDAASQICGTPVIENLMGGKPDAIPSRYAQGSPAELLPIGVNMALISTSFGLTPQAAEAFRANASAKGDKVDVHVIADSGHFEPIAPGTVEWREVEAQILRFAGVMPH